MISPITFHVTTYRGVEIDEDRAGHIFSASSLGEKGFEGACLANISCIGVHATVRFEAMLQQVPAGDSPSVWIWEPCTVRCVITAVRRRHTVPKRCSPAGYRPGRYEDDRPRCKMSAGQTRQDNNDLSCWWLSHWHALTPRVQGVDVGSGGVNIGGERVWIIFTLPRLSC